jgi:hypothetical protein
VPEKGFGERSTAPQNRRVSAAGRAFARPRGLCVGERSAPARGGRYSVAFRTHVVPPPVYPVATVAWSILSPTVVRSLPSRQSLGLSCRDRQYTSNALPRKYGPSALNGCLSSSRDAHRRTQPSRFGYGVAAVPRRKSARQICRAVNFGRLRRPTGVSPPDHARVRPGAMAIYDGIFFIFFGSYALQ